jgi:hypothetical protein
LRAPGDGGPLAEVVALGGDAIAASAGTGPYGRPEPLRPDHPFRRVLADLSRGLELPEHELYGAPPGSLVVEPGIPYLVRIGVDLARRTTAREQRFLLGRAAARLRSRSCLGELLAPKALAAWATAVARVAMGGAADDDMARQVQKELSRRDRRSLEASSRALLGAIPQPDAGAWCAAAKRTADRLGLLFCGDVPTAVETLLRDGSERPADRAKAIVAAALRPDARALLAFAATDLHFALRQRMRVAIA